MAFAVLSWDGSRQTPLDFIAPKRLSCLTHSKLRIQSFRASIRETHYYTKNPLQSQRLGRQDAAERGP